MAPKKLLSPSRSLRRWRASFSVISPEERSASIAICLPGMESRVNRAATSAIRPEPLVITTKFTITRMANTITPITTLPCMTKAPKAWMTSPAASVPSAPFERISRVEAILRPRRRRVVINSTAGKAENSSGRLMKSAVISTRTAIEIEIASARSSSMLGIGRINITRMPRMPTARATSPLRIRFRKACGSKAPLLGPIEPEAEVSAKTYPITRLRRPWRAGWAGEP